MKKRNHARRERSFSPRRKSPAKFARRKTQKRRNWTFERLEDRHYLSANPLADWQFVSLSNDTPEGAAAIWLRELEWAVYQAANLGDVDPNYTTMALPNDPMFPFQWHLLNTGQEVGSPDFAPIFGVAGEDINVVPAWNMGYTGEGVTVAVLDSGVQMHHPDLVGNIHPTLRFNAITGTQNANPSLIDPSGYHGTAVAGLIAATWNNLGDQIVDENGDPVFDGDGNPVFSGGGTGVAPNATLVPIRLGLGPGILAPITQFQDAFLFAIQSEIDITNNSWGPGNERQAVPMPIDPVTGATIHQLLRDSTIFGRDGLGMIHVFAAGNNGGPDLSSGFGTIGNYASTSYNPWVNSRHTIGVTGVDHTGIYANPDGTFTTYPTAGPSVLVAAPTGSNHFAVNIANDDGRGSGIWTTDLIGDFGANAAPLPSGLDPDRDFWPDPDYMSRFNGTSASAPIASGVIALMLEANPNLTYRDVQEILVRSARQNAQFEIPSSGSGEAPRTTWITNQTAIFRDPDPWTPFPIGLPEPLLPFQAISNPLADPSIFRHYEAQPHMFTNGAGYTVSQGYGVFGEQVGYGHGVIDAELAVQMAEQWHVLGQGINPATERTFTTFFFPGAGTGVTGLNLPAAERMPLNLGGMLVPGGIGGIGGFIDFWNEYFEDLEIDDDTGEPESGPFSGDDPPVNTRGAPFIEFSVPDEQAINVEWVEVKVEIAGPTENLDHLRMLLVSPDGTHSDLHNWYVDTAPTPRSFQPGTGSTGSGWSIDFAESIHPGEGNFVWTFSTNRHWGESSADAVIIDPITGEPAVGTVFDFDQGAFVDQALTRGWRLFIENWSTEDLNLQGVEIAWHGKPIQGETDATGEFVAAQRVQGLVGIDIDGDNQFNYDRYHQTYIGADPLEIRAQDLFREMDLDQEPFAANILVEAYRVVDGTPQNVPTSRFLTGHDGNYYFDLVPGEYVIRATDPLNRDLLDDVATGPGFQPHYQSEWHISEDWFYAPAREDLTLDPARFGNPGEILFDDDLGAPVPFLGDLGEPVPAALKGLNFLIKDPAPPNEIIINGTVIADLNGNGVFDGDDTPAGGIFVYWDQNRNGQHDAGEPMVMTSTDPLDPGSFSMTIPASAAGTFSLGVIPPTIDWVPTNPVSGVKDVFARPGDVIDNFNFLIQPPADAFPDAGANLPGNILGVVFNDRNANGVRNAGEEGVPGFRVFVDMNENGVWDEGEPFTFTTGNGSYFLSDVPPGLHRIMVEVDSSWELTSPPPPISFREVELGPGGVVSGVSFGLKNLADRDWGSLAGYPTLAIENGPSHTIVPGVHLGTSVFGSVDGQPGATPADHDGILIVSNDGVLRPGENVLRVDVSGVGLFLNAWMDINNDGDWDDPGEHILVDVPLTPGTHHLTVVLPDELAVGPIASRFRWGTPHLSYTGHSPTGEVEDYLFPTVLGTGGTVPVAGDFDGSGVVDDADYVEWKSNFGAASGGIGGVEVFDAAAYTVWRDNYGASGTGAALASGSDTVEPISVSSETAPLKDEESWNLLASGQTFETLLVEQTASLSGSLAGGALASAADDGATVSPRLLLEEHSDSGRGGLSLIDWFTSSDTSPRERAGVAAGAFAEDARLRDLVLAGLADRRDRASDGDAAWVRRDGDDDEGRDGLALAAVFDEETDWRVLD